MNKKTSFLALSAFIFAGLSSSTAGFAEDCVTIPPTDNTCVPDQFDATPRRLESATWNFSPSALNNGSLAGCGLPDGAEMPAPFGNSQFGMSGPHLPTSPNPYPVYGFCREAKLGGCTPAQVNVQDCKITEIKYVATSCTFCACTKSGEVAPEGKRDGCCTKQIHVEYNLDKGTKVNVCGCAKDGELSNFASDCCSQTRGFDGRCIPSPFKNL